MSTIGHSLFVSLSLHLLLLWALLALCKAPGGIAPALVVELAEIESAPGHCFPPAKESEKPESAPAVVPVSPGPHLPRRVTKVRVEKNLSPLHSMSASPLPDAGTGPAEQERPHFQATTPSSVEGSDGPCAGTGTVGGGGDDSSGGSNRGTVSADSGKGEAGEAAGRRYVNEQFAYIMEIIKRRLVYPQRARRAGWEGNVGVSFVIAESGQVAEIRVVESSGHELLDENVVAAIRAAAPFPPPPARAELRMPIQYRLDR